MVLIVTVTVFIEQETVLFACKGLLFTVETVVGMVDSVLAAVGIVLPGVLADESVASRRFSNVLFVSRNCCKSLLSIL